MCVREISVASNKAIHRTTHTSEMMASPPRSIKTSLPADISVSSSTTQLSLEDLRNGGGGGSSSSSSSMTIVGAQLVTKGTPVTVAMTTTTTTPSTIGSTFEVESGLSRLRELELRRLQLRQQRFSLEQRLYEFCGSTGCSSSTTTPRMESPNMGGKHVVKDVSFELYKYTGPLHQELGIPHGSNARIEFVDGQIYEGSVEQGVRSGHGRNLWKDGQSYVGEWKNNSRNGRGTHQWPDGRKACGTWKDGHLNGKVRTVVTIHPIPSIFVVCYCLPRLSHSSFSSGLLFMGQWCYL